MIPAKTPEEKVEKVIFSPNKGPQTDFLSAPEQEVLYGGAAGGGKSYAMLADPVRYFNNPYANMLLVRRTTEELRELIIKSKELYTKFDKRMKWSERDKTWSHPSGARLWMSYLDRDDDVTRYQGQAFSWIGFDELTQWPSSYAWDYMRSRLRTTNDSGLKLYQRACVDEGEVLTETGWKAIQDVKEGEKVWSVDHGGKASLKKVTKFHEFDVEEDLLRIKKKNLYMSITPDHRVVYSKQGSSKRELIRFNEHKSKSLDLLRTFDAYEAEGYDPELFNFTPESYAQFLGLYVAEGSINHTVHKSNYKVIITQNKVENHSFVREVMKSSGLNVCYSKNGDFQINNKTLRSHLAPLGRSHQKHFPRKFLNKASKKQLELAFKAYALGDGHWQSDKSVSLFTTSDQLADDLQEICLKLGYKSNRTYQVLDNPNHKNRWVIYVSLRGSTTKIDKGNIRNDIFYEPYKGKVYCLSVENNENFVLRQKGSVWISGNTSNPGGIGHSWVKKMFVDPETPGVAFDAMNEEGDVLAWPANSEFAQRNNIVGQPMFKRRFIPATLFDNPYLSQDGNYEANLLSLPEHQRRQLLEGDWDIAEGAAFPEFSRKLHVIEPFDVPDNWTKFRACDYGYSSWSAVLWFAIHPATDQLIVYREMYVSKVLAEDLADMVLETERGEGIRYGVLDSSLWHKRGDTGPSIAERMIRKGCRWRPADRSRGSRVSGKNEVHRRLQIDEILEEPRLLIFSTCKKTIEQIPSLPLDRRNPEDVDTNSEDHIYDALRYGLMSRPRSYSWGENPVFRQSYTPVDSTFGY